MDETPIIHPEPPTAQDALTDAQDVEPREPEPQGPEPDAAELKDLLNSLWEQYPAVRDHGRLRDLRAQWGQTD